MFPGTVIFLALEYPRFGMLHAPHTPGMWNRCEYRGTRKGRGLVTCGYASVIMASWEICKWRWPGKTSKWVIFHCHVWLEDTFWAVVSFVSLLTQPHGFELASISECQRLTPREFVRQNEQFCSEWLCSPVGVQCKTVQSFLQYRAFQPVKKLCGCVPKNNLVQKREKDIQTFRKTSGADEVSLSQHSRRPAGWLDDSLISLGFSWCSLQLKKSKSECKQQNYDPKIIKICENAKNKHGHSKLAVKRS